MHIRLHVLPLIYVI